MTHDEEVMASRLDQVRRAEFRRFRRAEIRDMARQLMIAGAPNAEGAVQKATEIFDKIQSIDIPFSSTATPYEATP